LRELAGIEGLLGQEAHGQEAHGVR
jgi:hypothetical protein